MYIPANESEYTPENMLRSDITAIDSISGNILQ